MAQTYVPLSDEDRRWAASTHIEEGQVFRGTADARLSPRMACNTQALGPLSAVSCTRTMRAAAELGGFDRG